jgi:tetraacyldisaccharide-1-P 4'-kinase
VREPLMGLARADAVIVTRADQPFDESLVRRTVEKYCRPHTPVFRAHHEVTGLRPLNAGEEGRVSGAAAFAGLPVAALSGVARPDMFVADLLRLGMKVVLRRDFEDHHRYTRDEFTRFAAQARSAGAEAIILTEKDAANLPPEALAGRGLPVYASRIEFRCREEGALKKLVRAAAEKTK